MAAEPMGFLDASDHLNTLILQRVGVAEERELLERAAALDAHAMRTIYDRHHVALGTFAQRLLGDVQAAEDLVHDVFILLPRLLGRFEPGRSLHSFLLSIAANHARHHLRSAARRRRKVESYAREPRSTTET